MIENLILLTGEDTFRLQERLRVLKVGFRKKYPDGEIKIFETPLRGSGHENRAELQKLYELTCTPNLFGGKRLAICEEDWWNPEKFDEADSFFQALPHNADTASVLIIQPKLDKRTKWSKFLLENARKEVFDPLDEASLLRWMEQRAEKFGAILSRKEALFLMERCGTDLWHLASEIEKLAMAADEKIISQHLIKHLTLPHPQLEIWGFLDHLSQKQTAKAIVKFRSLLGMGNPIHQLFSMLQRELRVYAQLRAGMDQGLRETEITQRTKLHPFVVKKALPHIQQFSMKKIKNLYDELFDIEKRMKSGGIIVTTNDTRPLEIAIEKFIVKCCHHD